MKHYLSIDADYWTDADRAHDQLTAVVKQARRRNLPLVSVMNHQQLLPFVNTAPATKLINVDEHSDLCDCAIRRLECGSWVAYVRWRRDGEYLWIRRHRSTVNGSCNGHLYWNDGNDWGEARSKFHPSLDVASLVNRDCVGVGLCMSPAYANKPVQRAFDSVIRELQVPWVKGRRRESHERRIAPPFTDARLVQRARALQYGH